MTNLERWNYYYQDIESPDLFVRWTALCTVSAALQRRVCLDHIPHLAVGRPLFANLYNIFIGPPGVGKSTAAYGSIELFKSFGGFERLEDAPKRKIKVAPSSTTLEALIRYLNNNYVLTKLPTEFIKCDISGNKLDKYISAPLAFFATEELGTLFRENTSDLVKFVTQGYDCGDFDRDTKTQGVDFIKNMCMTLLGCATPDWITEVSQNGLLKQGFSARTIFVWGGEKRHIRRKYTFTEDQQKELKLFRNHLEKLLDVYGPIKESPEAEEWMTTWYEKGGEQNRLNKDKRLIDYYARKKVHLMKVAMVIHFMDKTDLILTVDDYVKALKLLDETEREMHLALLGTASVNPAYMVATKILESLERQWRNAGCPPSAPYVREGILLNDVFEDCTNGMATFQDAVKYLQDSTQIASQPVNGKICHKLKETPEKN